MKQQTLILDLDDTLIHCNKYFQESRKHFVNVMKDWFGSIAGDEILQKHSEIDVLMTQKKGLHSSVYPETFVKTYRHFCWKLNRNIKKKEENQVREIGQNVFLKEVQPFPHMYEVLNELQKDGHHLYLFTGGDVANQSRKITQLGLEEYFSKGVFIFEHKNANALQKILGKIKANKKTTWMIGNSLKTDVLPAIELGINAIHIPAKFEWSYNIIDIDVEPRGTFAELESLFHLPEYIREYSFCFEAI